MTEIEKHEADEFATAIQSMAETFIESSSKVLNLDYDYSPKTLQIIDQALAVYHPEGFVFETAWHSHAAYAGEVVRRALGGKWVKEADGSGASLRGVGGKATIYPFLWISKRIDSIVQGTDENAISRKYLKLLQMLDREAEAPDALPSDFVHKHAQGMEQEAGGEGRDDATDAISAASDAAGADGNDDQDDTLKSSLAMAPTICFFMIAGADGNIDKKEAKSFLIEVVKYATHQNPLVREIFGSTPSRFAEHCNAISESAPLAVLKLALCKVAAETTNPDHAKEFCQVLFNMSKTIASSSGGFFSRGKVSKDEQKVLDVIAQTLGLKD